MSRRAGRVRARAALALGASLILGWAARTPVRAEAPGPGAHRLHVTVEWGERSGPETLRRELAAELLAALEHAGCMARVAGADAAAAPREPADLELRLLLSEFEEEVRHDGSLAQTYASRKPPGSARETARLAVDVALRLTLAGPPEAVVRERSFRHGTAHRPLFDEDPRETARAQLVEELVARARSFVCRGGGRKLEREIDEARRPR